MMQILVQQVATIDDHTVRSVVDRFLESITKEEWVEERTFKGEKQFVLMHEVHTSHKFDTEVEYQDPVRIKIVQAVQDFRKALKEYEQAQSKDGRK